MRGAIVILITCILVSSTVAAVPGDSATNGLSNACANATASKPCEHLGIIPDTTVGAGETRQYVDGDYEAQGTIVVESGGTVIVDNATIAFSETSDGFIVLTGGALLITDATLQEDTAGSEFGIDAQAGSTFKLVQSELWGGSGIHLATNDAEIHDDTIGYIPVALRNDHVNVTIHAVHFLNNDVAVNNTGGAPVLHNNTFEGGTTCVRDWLTDPTIVHNKFRGCHTGIFHHRSESTLSFNDMEDDDNPPGTGILVKDTMSPTIEGNIIKDYGTGILISNARAYIRNNNIHSNIGDGIRVENNSAPMDITGNTVHLNGGHGIFLSGASTMVVANNTVANNTLSGITVHANAGAVQVHGNGIRHNGGDGIHLAGASGVPVYLNDVASNAGDGIKVQGGSGNVIDWNFVSGSGFRGIAVGSALSSHVQRNWVNETWAQAIHVSASPGIQVQRNFVSEANFGIWVQGSLGASLYYNDVHGANDAAVMVMSDNVTLFGDQARASGRGFVFFDAEGAIGDLLSATSNRNSGFHVDGGGSHDLRNVNASGNVGDGFVFSDDTTSPSTLRHPRAIGNGGDGLASAGGDNVLVVQGWYENNQGAGVRNTHTNFTLVTENAYWGSPSGPTHPDNPNGTGDEVVGLVDYQPYATTPPGPWSPPAMLD